MVDAVECTGSECQYRDTYFFQESAMFSLYAPWVKILFLAVLPLSLLVSGCASTQNEAAESAMMQEGVMIVKGKVQKLSLEEGSMVVAPPKGERVTLKISEQASVKGGSIKEIARFQPVRVHYTLEGQQNMIVSIEILPKAECGEK
jgi:hypothetical protein